MCRHLRRREEPTLAAALLVVEAEQLADLQLRDELFGRLLPWRRWWRRELVARLEHLFFRSGRRLAPE